MRFQILSVSTAPEDHKALLAILSDPRWQIAKARTCKEAIVRLGRRRMPVVICESDLPDGTWRDMLDQLGQLVDPPLLIVTSRRADDYLWAEVLNLGGYNVLTKPFHETEVKYVVEAAWRQKHSPVRQATASSCA